MNTMNNLTVEEGNEEIVKTLIPNIVIFSVYLILGLCGNALVVLVYMTRMKNVPDERYYIPVLAMSDLIASTYGSSFGILQCVHF